MQRLTSRSTLAALLVLCGPACAVQSSRAAAEEPRPAPPAPAPKAQGGMRETVETLLSGYERVPTPEDWKALGPGALEALGQIYADPSALPSLRTRAVSSMALVDNPEAVSRLTAILADGSAGAQYRSTAVLALAHRTGEKALPQLEAALADPSPEVREAAAQALGRLDVPAARSALEGRLAAEKDPAVRESLERGLKKAHP